MLQKAQLSECGEEKQLISINFHPSLVAKEEKLGRAFTASAVDKFLLVERQTSRKNHLKFPEKR